MANEWIAVTVLAALTLCVAIATLIIVAVRTKKGRSDSCATDSEELIINSLKEASDDIKKSTADAVRSGSEVVTAAINSASGTQVAAVSEHMRNITDITENTRKSVSDGFRILGEQTDVSMRAVRAEVTSRLDVMSGQVGTQLEKVRQDNARQLEQVRQDNEKQLSAMRDTVDEKLSKTLNERLTQSFNNVQASLDNVNRGLGEMKQLSENVRDINKIMGGVKTRGMWGEDSLAGLLQDIFTPEQYEAQYHIKRGAKEAVDFVIRMPGEDGDKGVLLPIDCKFPSENYQRLVEASEAGDAAAVAVYKKALYNDVLTQARSIRDKYISVPATTNFAVMYLPAEGLYAEVVRTPGLTEKLRQECSVVVSGPSTTTALLNSLQMGFRSLKIQKNSQQVQQAFARFSTEFGRFNALIAKAQSQNEQVGKTLSDAQSRNDRIQRTLSKLSKDSPLAVEAQDSIAAIEGEGGDNED